MSQSAALAPLRQRWNTLAPREQALVLGAAWLVGLALLWWVLVSPALTTVRQAAEQQRSLDMQLQKMRSLQAQAQALQSQPKISRDEALRALEASVKQRLGAGAQFNVVGDRATIKLKSVPAEALSQWLTQARINARATPAEARLIRVAGVPSAAATAAMAARASAAIVLSAEEGSTESSGAAVPPPPPPAPAAAVAWDGTLVMNLPVQ